MTHFRRRCLAAVSCSLLFAIAALSLQARAPDETNQPPLRKFMREKLEISGTILEGLTTEDYELIEAGAKRLATMSQAEQWRMSNDALYRQYSSEFQRMTERLAEHGKAQNLDA